MICVHGSMKTEKAIQLVNSRLSKFKLDLDNNIVATITDGASVMMKFGKETGPIHIACLAHAIHLCICDLLYKTHKMNDDVIDDITEEEDDYDETEMWFNKVDIGVIVAKICKIVKVCQSLSQCP